MFLLNKSVVLINKTFITKKLSQVVIVVLNIRQYRQLGTILFLLKETNLHNLRHLRAKVLMNKTFKTIKTKFTPRYRCITKTIKEPYVWG